MLGVRLIMTTVEYNDHAQQLTILCNSLSYAPTMPRWRRRSYFSLSIFICIPWRFWGYPHLRIGSGIHRYQGLFLSHQTFLQRHGMGFWSSLLRLLVRKLYTPRFYDLYICFRLLILNYSFYSPKLSQRFDSSSLLPDMIKGSCNDNRTH
ncbi:hypothetical protein BT63DRAFT_140997 [Microthyrium microscopicum]|uniref:Uncharacterized protein n=1 Tax=Microthyrium microscopicum TaxID=703497 RepID=A0A6A6UL52_9PEZI|nr:hypothetical protein BT63DRAFT_140997 [Microthyrium microscopicum]